MTKWHKTKATLASGKTKATLASSKVVVNMVASRAVADRVLTSSNRTRTGGTRPIATINSKVVAETKTA